MIIIHTLGCTVHFLNEQHTEPYNKYGKGVTQVKNVLDAKSSSQEQTCFALERSDV